MNITWLLWILFIVLLAVFLGAPRMFIPRQPDGESLNDAESIKSCKQVSRFFIFDYIRRMALKRIAPPRPGAVMVDLDYGADFMLAELSSHFPQAKVMGIEISPPMLNNAANDTGSQAGAGFLQADITRLPLKDNSVDFIVSTLSLHHWSSPLDGLMEIERVLKPCGQFLILDLRRDSRRWFYLLLVIAQALFAPRVIKRVNGVVGSYWASYTPMEITDIINQTGITEWKLETAPGWFFISGYKM